MKKTLILHGDIVALDTANTNGFIFPKECAEKIVEQFNKDKDICPIYGALEENDPRMVNNASHEVINLELKGDKIVGSLKILDTADGDKLRHLIEEHIPLYGMYVVDSNIISNDSSKNIKLNVNKLLSVNITTQRYDNAKEPLVVENGMRTEEEWIQLFETLYSTDVLWYVLGGLISSDSFCYIPNNEVYQRYEESIDTLKKMVELIPKSTIPYKDRRKATSLAKKGLKMIMKEYKQLNNN
jgi:hypothetical protein